MKNLNSYEKGYIEKVKEGGKLEDIYDYYQIDNISVTKSQNKYVINIRVVTHTEEIYVHKHKKYTLDTYNKIDCNEIFTVPFASTDEEKRALIENFVKDMYFNIFNYETKEISEKEYNGYREMTKEEIKSRLKNAII